MYQSGELDRVMAAFESGIKSMPVYVGGSMERADKVEVELGNGRISRRYKNNNYYNNGTVNQLFVAYLAGYANGKVEGRMES